MSGQYLRRYRLLVTSKKAGAAYDVIGLRCTFHIEKAITDEPGYSEISIYNPAPGMTGKIRKGDQVILEAGYENGHYGMIFTGNIVQPIYKREDATTTVLILVCRDGDEYLKSSFVVRTLVKGATQKDVISEAVKSGGEVTRGDISEGIGEAAFARGKTLFGSSAEYLRQISRANNAQFYIEDGVVNIAKAADYKKNEAIELNPMTGLIGTPEQAEDGVNGRCLINPRIKLNTMVYINSKLVEMRKVEHGETKFSRPSSDGVYKIIKLIYEGDTHGDAWYINFDAVTQPGKQPVSLTGSKDNPWR